MVTFREMVEARYQVRIEVDAGFKDILKKSALFLTTALMFSNVANAFHFKPEVLKSYEKGMKKVMVDYSKDVGGNYDFKIEDSKSGGVQTVKFNIIKDGKVAGFLKFVGTKTDLHNSLNGGLTSEGKEDSWVGTVFETTKDTLTKKMHDEVGK